MIVTKRLKYLEDFKNLKKGDIVAVEWRSDVIINKRSRKRTRFASYEVADNLVDQTEIILQKPMNVYFNYGMFLDGVSNVRAITLLSTAEKEIEDE